jgi:hypothetical protein
VSKVLRAQRANSGDERRGLSRLLIGLGVMADRRIDAFYVAGDVVAHNVGRIFLLGVQIAWWACGLARGGGVALIRGLRAFIAGCGCECCEASGWASVLVFSDIASSNNAEADPFRDELFPRRGFLLSR